MSLAPGCHRRGGTVSASYAGGAAVCDVTKFTGTWVTPEPGAPSCSEQSGIDAVSLCVHRVMCPFTLAGSSHLFDLCHFRGRATVHDREADPDFHALAFRVG